MLITIFIWLSLLASLGQGIGSSSSTPKRFNRKSFNFPRFTMTPISFPKFELTPFNFTKFNLKPINLTAIFKELNKTSTEIDKEYQYFHYNRTTRTTRYRVTSQGQKYNWLSIVIIVFISFVVLRQLWKKKALMYSFVQSNIFCRGSVTDPASARLILRIQSDENIIPLELKQIIVEANSLEKVAGPRIAGIELERPWLRSHKLIVHWVEDMVLLSNSEEFVIQLPSEVVVSRKVSRILETATRRVDTKHVLVIIFGNGERIQVPWKEQESRPLSSIVNTKERQWSAVERIV